MVVENRNLPAKTGVKALDQFRGIREGFALDCEGGSFVGLRGGGWIYDRDGKRLRQFPGDGGGKHMANFLGAIRSRRPSELNAPPEEGHAASALCHLGNMSWRLGRPSATSACRDAVRDHATAAETVDLLERHLIANDVNLAKSRFLLGPWIELDPTTAEIRAVAGGDTAALAAARTLARGSDRGPYTFPG
jgi:hypothetical protein